MTTWRNRLLPGLLAALLGCGQPAPGSVRVAYRQTAAGTRYTFFYADSLAVRVATHRPSADDRQNLLSVAAAYTDLKTNQPLDVLVAAGHLRQAQATVGFLEGVLTLAGDSVAIGRVPMGQAPPRARLEQVAHQQGTLLLQELLVWEGRSVRGPGGARFQRRALAELAPGRFALVESRADSLTMQQFAADLAALGASRALYLDMGDWDEGWYRAGGQVVKLGYRRTQTARQSNWLVFSRPAATP